MTEFSERSVLVAGASRGIGESIAAVMARARANVFIGGRDGEALAKTADRLRESTGGRVTPLAGDYADANQAENILTQVGALDVLVICLGDTDCPPGFDISENIWRRLIHSNLDGPAMLARLGARTMRARRRGSILFIGSICGQEVLGAPIAYNAGKAALRAVVKTMARELGADGVRVNMISPGNILFEGGRWARKRAANPQQVDDLIRSTTPLGRFGTPAEIAEAALFLSSDRAAFITGTNLIVDGGQTIAI